MLPFLAGILTGIIICVLTVGVVGYWAMTHPQRSVKWMMHKMFGGKRDTSPLAVVPGSLLANMAPGNARDVQSSGDMGDSDSA